MNKKAKKRIKEAAYMCLWTVGGIALGTLTFVIGNKPSTGIDCSRSQYRADGVPKRAFDAPWKANLQCIKQLVFHGEKCYPYEYEGKFFTGHRR